MDSQVLTYSIPNNTKSLARGIRVEVEVRGRKMLGIVEDSHFNEPNFKTSEILRVIDKEPVLSEEQWKVAEWMEKTYLAGKGESLFRMLPQGRRLIREEEPEIQVDLDRKELNPEQKKAYEEISGQITLGHSVHLLFGITGSGKTEIYIRLMQDVLKNSDKGIIFLVPEISLTFHIIKKLEKIFPQDLALLHSGLKTSQRFRAYQALLKGEKRIAVGTRSAIFAPVQNPGLIIIDEEHDGSYKENSSPRYHTRQIAHFRSKLNSGVLVLGSATPNIETYHLAETGKIFLHKLTHRAVQNSKLPEVKIVQKKESEGAVGFELLNELKSQKQRGEQSILLLNRRGYSPLIYSTKDKKFIECPNCSTNLCYHRSGIVQCHICGHRESLDKLRSLHERIEFLGVGTQKLEDFLVENLPGSKIERLDQDSSKNQEVLTGVLSRLYKGDLDILTGTQMIAKGLDVPKVTLVGVINANQGLGVPDFRAGERVFALLTQVSGRAGRSNLQGRVIVEAQDPNHPVIQRAMRQDYLGFYNEEIHFRKQMNLPPFSRLVRLVVRSTEEERSMAEIQRIDGILRGYKEASVQILGPSPCPFYKIDKYFRNHILLKSKSLDPSREMVQKLRTEWKSKPKTYLEIDFDPVDLV
jgi:primosomal protein N' (replication factor Y)